MGDNWARADADAIAPNICVATTAGTGSDVGRAAERAAALGGTVLVAPDPAEARPRTHKVYPGQRLGSIAKRYNVSREAQDEYSLISQQRTAAAQKAGRYDDEIVPLETTWKKVDRETKEESFEQVVAVRDDCNRPDTTLEGLASLQPVFKDGQQVKQGRFVTAGNASQFSDGASACVIMHAKEAERRGVEALDVGEQARDPVVARGKAFEEQVRFVEPDFTKRPGPTEQAGKLEVGAEMAE